MKVSNTHTKRSIEYNVVDRESFQFANASSSAQDSTINFRAD